MSKTLSRAFRGAFSGVILVTALAGCAAPPAVMVAIYAADGVSYLASGKSGGDHLISALAEEDCAVHRVVTGGAVCRPVEGAVATDVQVASLAAGPYANHWSDNALAYDEADNMAVVAPTPNLGAPKSSGPMGVARDARRDVFSGAGTAAAAGGWTKAPSPRVFIVLATYQTRREADAAAVRIVPRAEFPLHRPKVISTLASARPVYRLTLGPFAPKDAAALRRDFAVGGYLAAVTLPGCDGAVSTACVDSN